ncbi:hypothetical protein BDV12DRAFT_204499 [Aspergillus spectabilis]
MNIGERIHSDLEKPIEAFRACLFQLAYSLCQRLDTVSSRELLLNTAISYARFVDHRSLTGPAQWLPVEACLADSAARAIGGDLSQASSEFLDFFCQSMWDSEHEYALFRFCGLIERTESRVSKKWLSRLESRWTELGITEESFESLSDSEVVILISLGLEY